MPLLKPWESAAVELFKIGKADTKLLKKAGPIIKRACVLYAEQYLEEIMLHLEKKLSYDTLAALVKDLKKK